MPVARPDIRHLGRRAGPPRRRGAGVHAAWRAMISAKVVSGTLLHSAVHLDVAPLLLVVLFLVAGFAALVAIVTTGEDRPPPPPRAQILLEEFARAKSSRRF
jgi:hypothetical protein